MLYEYVIKQSMLKDKLQSNTTSGKWIKYEQGSDYNILRDSLQGYYTGWCTAAGENFAKSQLANGDFYIYYTLDNNGEAKVPRIAIRMDGNNKIEEIRGIANKQNMEPEMMPILEKKLKEFPDRDKYLKKEHDMKLLTLIDKKVNNNIELTFDELKFLYEIDSKIEGFGYERDPRIDEIKKKRKIKKDYALIFDVKEEVALSQEEWKQNPNKFKILDSDLYLRHLVKPNGLVLPHHISGSLFLDGLYEADDLVFPQSIGGNLFLDGLYNAERLILPKSIGDTLVLGGLSTVEGVVLPQKIGNLDLSGIISPKGLILPRHIDGNLFLDYLSSTEGLVLPQSVGGNLFLDNLTSAEGLVLPQSVGGYLDIHNLDSAESLVLPQSIGGSLNLSGLTSANGLVLPYGFNLNKLICPSYIKNEILQNPDKYFRKPPSEEENISIHYKR